MIFSIRKTIKYDLYRLLFVLAIALKPLYLFKSGQLQISDYCFVTLCFLIVLSERRIIENNLCSTFLLLIVYQSIINCVWSVICSFQGYNGTMGASILFYAFNLMVTYCISRLCMRYGPSLIVSDFIKGIIIATIGSFVLVVLNRGHMGRAVGGFNNPNQLGYFCVIAFTAVFIYRNHCNKYIRWLTISLCIILAMKSMSKAAIIAILCALAVYNVFLIDGKKAKRFITFLGGVSILMLFLYFLFFSNSVVVARYPLITSVRNRLINMGKEADSNLGTGRGYNRVFEIGPNVLWGVGEGIYTRFSSLKGSEAHSTYVSVIVSYGILGFLGYVYLFAKAIYDKRIRLKSFIYYIGVFLYFMTHNGIRNTLLWALITLAWIEKNNNKESQFHLWE